MKKLYTLLVVALIGFVGKAQIVNIPDANFKNALIGNSSATFIAADTNGNVITIDTNDDNEIQEIEALQVFGLTINEGQIIDLTGIEKFTNLRTLNLKQNLITSVNLNQNINLTSVDVSENEITNLDVLFLLDLSTLNCSSNNLNSLDVSQIEILQTLNCASNNLNFIDVSQCFSLRDFFCDNNNLAVLDVSQNPLIETLICNNNNLTTLDVSQNLILIMEINCSFNQLSTLILPLGDSLIILNCENNLLSQLDFSNVGILSSLKCGNNLFETLDFSSINTLLTGAINASNNPFLTSLNFKNNFHEDLTFQIIDTNFSGLPSLQYICTDEDEELSYQFFFLNFFPNIVINTYCSFVPGGTFYTIQGNSKLDINSNGCDSNDLNFPNQKFAITNGAVSGSFISNESGIYSIPVQAGTHTITPILENPSYFNVTPPSVTVSFPTSASPFIQNFCLRPNSVFNDVEVTIIPIEAARPGFDAFYKIIYKNKGNQVSNGSLSFNFIDAIMDLVSATPIVNATGTNSLSWNYVNLNPFETREINLTFNINSPMEIPAVNGGDILNYNATIVGATDETPNDNSFTLNQTVVNSYDPNDKTCLEGTTITPSMVGQYVHYVIRFENTGTFAAQNVVIKDLIDTTKFDMATLVPQSSSHNFITRITDTNKVEFIFESINLPFDDANNDGYVAFKIKTKPTLVLGDTFSNSANIYFDYNFPIVTNTATTTVTALGTQDFYFEKYFTVYPNPAKEVLHIDTKTELGVKTFHIYNTLGQMVLVVTNPENNASIDVTNLKTGTYFIKVTSNLGTANAMFIRE